MKNKLVILFIITLLIIFNISSVFGETINISDICNDNSKIILYENEEIPDEAGVILVSEDKSDIILVPEERLHKFESYKIIGFIKDNTCYLYKSGEILLERINEIHISTDKKINFITRILFPAILILIISIITITLNKYNAEICLFILFIFCFIIIPFGIIYLKQKILIDSEEEIRKEIHYYEQPIIDITK